MKNQPTSLHTVSAMSNATLFRHSKTEEKAKLALKLVEEQPALPEIIFLTSYPPRECGIATYSQDLIQALKKTFTNSFSIKVCALEVEGEEKNYPDEVKYILDTALSSSYHQLAETINTNSSVSMVMIQHEFGLFENAAFFQKFLESLIKPVVIVFHTVLPAPEDSLKLRVKKISQYCSNIICMTNNSLDILVRDYQIPADKISVIEHGTHLVPHLNRDVLKNKYKLQDKKVLSTFGLLSAGKGIETTLKALPGIIKKNPDVVFLIIGKTHPGVVKQEGEKYRNDLKRLVSEMDIEKNVIFINAYLELNQLLEYLQLSDIYIFSSIDPHQAVSGTFSYAMSAGCAVVSTPIPHALEVLKTGAGIIVSFNNPGQLTEAVNNLFSDDNKRREIVNNSLHRMVSTAWENSAVAHAQIFKKIAGAKIDLHFKMPPVNLNHLQKMTTENGLLQFSKLNEPDPDFGYTLDDNARALIAMCMHYKQTKDSASLKSVETYFGFIQYCMQNEGYFLNYTNENMHFTDQNTTCNLADANGRAVWALGYLCSLADDLPSHLIEGARQMINSVLPRLGSLYSTRAMAFIIKGLYYYNIRERSPYITSVIEMFAGRMVNMYRHEAEAGWEWYESYLTYGNCVLSEAMLCAYSETGEKMYRDTAISSFTFLLNNTFKDDRINVISNKGWFHKGSERSHYGEQPIDVAYTILALDNFFQVTGNKDYLKKMEVAFSWFLGNNHLHQIIYNPCTGGCYDGLEDTHVNLNQGAESTLSYLLSRLTMHKYSRERKKPAALTLYN